MNLLATYIEEHGGEFRPGVSNRSNSHGMAESNVKICAEGLRSVLFTAQSPFKYWPKAGRTWSMNFCFDRGLRVAGYVAAEQFVWGETAHLRLEASVYSPPVVSPKGTQCMFLGYGRSHAIDVEFFDVNLGKRRQTQTTAASFHAGLPRQGRPIFAFEMKPAEKDRLTSVFRPLLLGEENQPVINIPQAKETPNPRGRPKSKAKKNERSRAAQLVEDISENEFLQVENDSTNEVDLFDPDVFAEFSFFVDTYGDPTGSEQSNLSLASSLTANEYHVLEESELEPSSFPEFETVVNLGRPEEDDAMPTRHPLEVSVGEPETVSNKPREGRMFVKIAKVVSQKEADTTYAHLDWPGAWSKEQTKYFETFKCLGEQPLELWDLPVGSHVGRLFPIRTVKNFENKAEHLASLRVALAGNNVQYLTSNNTWKKAPSVKKNTDTVSSASVESQRVFFITQRMLRRVLKQKDALGAYLQKKYDDKVKKSRRPGGLWAILPRSMIPPGNKGHEMKCPVYEVTGAIYGLEESGFLYDDFTVENMTANNWGHLFDVEPAISIHGMKDPLSQVEGEPDYEAISEYEHAAMRYVDDFIAASVPGKSIPSFGVQMKDDDDEVTKFIGQEVIFIEREDRADMIFGQISYVEKLVTDFKDLLAKKQMRPLKTYDTPAEKEVVPKEPNGPVEKPTTEEATMLEENNDEEPPGKFANECSSLVQSLQYVARLTRPEILFAVSRCSRYLTRWRGRHDNWIVRIYGYLQGTIHFVLHMLLKPNEIFVVELLVFFDADYAGCRDTRRSTTGVFAVLFGPTTWAPILFISKRQGEVSLSTPESETCSCITAYKRVTRLSMLVNVMWRRNVPVKYFGDNTACERVVSTGSLQLAYMKRSQGVNLAAARSLVAPNLGRVPSGHNFSDIFTKPLEGQLFHNFRKMLGVF